MKLNSPQQRSTPTRVSLPSMIDALEPRRLLAVFAGTENSDTIRITRVGSFTHVNINNNDFATTDSAINISALGGNDFVLMDYVHPNIVVNLGAGNDRVTYGGQTHDIFGNLPETLLVGGAGIDTVNFDDSGGPQQPRRDYLFDDERAMNQILLDFENLELRTRGGTEVGDNQIRFTDGFVVSQRITVTGDGINSNEMQIGTAANPIDLDRYNLTFVHDVDTSTNIEVFDQDFDLSAQPFHIYTSGGNTQHIAKGGFDLTGFRSIDLHGGTTADQFGIGGILGHLQLAIYGGAGNDVLFTNNDNGHDNDLDDVFPFLAVGNIGSLTFLGEDGLDLVDLDDSNDQVGDNDQDYFLTDEILDKGPAGGRLRLFYFGQTTELITLKADADNNTISFASGVGQQMTIDGGIGSDTFRLHDDFELQQSRGTVTLKGGSGADSLTISDTNPSFQEIRQYTLAGGNLSYADANGPLGNISADGAIESFTLTENDASATTNLVSRLGSTALILNAGAGDDTVTVGGGDLDSSGLLSSNITLGGGTGNDSIIFDDRLDSSNDGTTSVITMTNNSIAKGTPTLLYGAFDFQTLLAANFAAPLQIEAVPVVNLNGIAAAYDQTTIVGGVNRGCIVNVGATSLSSIAGIVNVSNLTSLTVNDAGQTFGATSSFEINNSQVRKTSTAQTINYTNVGQITLNTRNSSTIADVINVRSTPAGTTVIVNANAGNDNVSMGGGNIDANLLGPVTINAGAGFDFAGFSNGSDTSLEALTLNGLSLTDGPRTYSFTGAEELRVTLGTGGTNMTVNSVVTTTYFTGGAGNESFDIGGGDLDTNIPATTGGAASVIIEGLGGDDSIRFNDLNDTGIDSYEFQRLFGADLLIKRAGGIDHVIAWFGINRATLDASNEPAAFLTPSSITVTDVITPLRINGNGGSDDVGVVHAASPVIVNTGLGDADHLRMSANAGTVVIEQSDDVENLTIGGGNTLRVGAGAVLVKTRNEPLTGFLTLTGVLDLAGGAFLSRAGGPITPQVARDKIIVGRNNGAWNGTSNGAINSSLAAGSALSDGVGYGLGSEIALTTIGPFTITAGDTLLRYTLDGDADLNQQVNLDDFTRLAVGFGTATNAWTRGDFNYNGFTNLDDFTALAGSFGQVLPAALPGANQGQATRSPFGSRLILSLDDSLN